MDILKKLPLMLLPAALTGCYENFTPDIDSTPVLSVSALVTDGEPIEVTIGHSVDYTDEDKPYREVTDAGVTVYVNGAEVTEDYLPRQGDRVRIEVYSPTYGSAAGEVTVPVSVAPDEVRYTLSDVRRVKYESYEGETEENVAFNLLVEVRITDPSDTENYYRMDWRPTGTQFYCGEMDYEAEPIFSEHIGIFESAAGSTAGQFSFFTDRQFAGSTYAVHLHFKNCAVRVNPDGTLPDCGLEVLLKSVSASYYYLANYVWQTTEGVFFDLGETGLGEPRAGYSNVTSGAGVVGAQSTAGCSLDLGEALREALQTAHFIRGTMADGDGSSINIR